ncbi:MAG: sortase [Acidimicrobiia bacterium]
MDDAPAPLVEQSAPTSRGLLTRVIRAVGWTSIIVGVLILGFVVQQLFVTSWFAEQHQEALGEEATEHFATAEITEELYVPPASTNGSGGSGTIVDGASGSTNDNGVPTGRAPRIIAVESAPELGSAFAVIRIPTIEALQEGWAVVEGVRVGDLKNGAGHMPHTPMPGMPGNSVISGHRTTYGAPFHDVDTLNPGDRIEVETAVGVNTYEVRELIIVRPTELWVTEPRDGAWLTLTTCHPKFSSRQRLIVLAELVDGPNFEAIYA